jgi:hypothetical protein
LNRLAPENQRVLPPVVKTQTPIQNHHLTPSNNSRIINQQQLTPTRTSKVSHSQIYNSGMAGVRQSREIVHNRKSAHNENKVRNSLSPVPKRSITYDGDGIVSKKLNLSPEGTKYSLVNRRSSSHHKNAPRVNTPNRLKVSGVRTEI